MKLIITSAFFVLFFLSVFQAQAQENTVFPEKPKAKFLVGYRYIPFDYYGGPVLGFSVNYKRFEFSVRNDAALRIQRKDSANYFGVSEYRTFNYLEAGYYFRKSTMVSVAYGWISNSDDPVRQNNDYGYLVLSLAGRQMLSSNIGLELRMDINFADPKKKLLFDLNHAFPASAALFYVFR